MSNARKVDALLKTLLLREPRLTLAAAESLTCGRVQARIGAISGASGFFLGGITAYTIAQKARHLGVDRRLAAKVDAVSDEVARQMARGALELFGADLAVATTGYAEPAKARGVAEPMAHWALVHRRRGRIVAERGGMLVLPKMTRAQAQETVAETVVAELAGYLAEARGG